MRCLLCVLTLVLLAGCRSQTTAMSNPFLAPNRVPPPATRTLLPGTAQPYYPGDPLPNSPAIAAPPVGFAPGTTLQPTATPTYAPQSPGVQPPGGWNGAPQTYPRGSSSRNVLPSNIQPAASIVPVTVQPFVSPYPNQVATYQAPGAQQLFVQQAIPAGEQRQVRIRAISSENLNPQNLNPRNSPSASSDGFRPQGSSLVRKPTMASRLMPRKREPLRETSTRFGFDPQYDWLRGQLRLAPETGQWRLQYALDPGRVDQFGGTLAIANPQVLGDLQPGDYVQLRGRVDRVPRDETPIYTVSVVRRQRI